MGGGHTGDTRCRQVGESQCSSMLTTHTSENMKFAQLQWLMSTNVTGAPATYTTDEANNLVLQTNAPAMKIWTQGVSGASAMVQTCLTPMALNVFSTPGTIITTSTNASGVFVGSMTPDEYGFGGGVDMSIFPTGFFGVQVDTAP